MVLIAAAVRTGRVLFSTTMVWPVAAWATSRAQASTQRRSLACPAPRPLVLVGVFTEMKTMSAAAIEADTSVEKCRLRPRARSTTRSSPGSYTGNLLRSASFQASMRAWLMSTTCTCTLGQRSAITAMVGPPT